MEIGLGETVFPFQMILASGRYMTGISYFHQLLHPFLARIDRVKPTFARRDGSSKAS
jgi:hypothetical protein